MKSYTDIEQSRKLAEILPLETADMYYPNRIDIKYQGALPIEYKHGNPLLSQEIASWSLVALLDILPFPQLSKDKLGSGKIGWMVSVFPDNCRSDSHWHKNPIDACYEMIINLKELKLL
jgi:hypothetical protein